MGYLARNWRADAAAHSPSVWYHEGNSFSDSGIIERFRFGDEVSDEGSRDTGIGESAGLVGVSWVDDRSGGEERDNGEGTSVLDLLTGLREKRDFFELLRGEGSIRAEKRVREGGLASGSRPSRRALRSSPLL